MEKAMTPSMMTNGQIDKAVSLYRAKLEKHRNELPSEAVQIVLGQHDLAVEQFNVLRKRVEAISEMIVRRVKVNRALTPQQVLDATGRKQYTDATAVASMPAGEGEEVEVCFFPLKKFSSDAEVEQALSFRGLVADPYAQAQVNAEDPAFADEHPNGISWKDKNGNWNFVTFHRWRDGERRVFVYRVGRGWVDRWWVAGVRK